VVGIDLHWVILVLCCSHVQCESESAPTANPLGPQTATGDEEQLNENGIETEAEAEPIRTAL
jgi:hypothetical protein